MKPYYDAEGITIYHGDYRDVLPDIASSTVNLLLCKIFCHNLCCVIQSMYELGVDVDFRAS
jgi:hypothetical protein